MDKKAGNVRGRTIFTQIVYPVEECRGVKTRMIRKRKGKTWQEFWKKCRISCRENLESFTAWYRKRMLRKWALEGLQIVVSPCFSLMSPEYFVLHSKKEVKREAVRIFEKLEAEREKMLKEQTILSDG